MDSRGFRRTFDHRQDAGAERDVVLRICPCGREPQTDFDLYAAVGTIADKNFGCRVLQGKRVAIEGSGGRTRSTGCLREMTPIIIVCPCQTGTCVSLCTAKICS